MAPSLYLSRFNLPLPDAWQAEQIDRLAPTERARLARIFRPQRRAQFLVAHCTLRWGLTAAGIDRTTIEVDAEGRLLLHASVPVYASIAHSAEAVTVIVAGNPIGVDLESPRPTRDLSAAAGMLGLASDGFAEPGAVLRAWVIAEARLKAGSRASSGVWLSSWETFQLAVAGTASPPLTGMFDGITGIYNAATLQWEAV